MSLNKLELTKEFISKFPLGGLTNNEVKEIANNILTMTERLYQEKNQQDYQKLVGLLKYYELPFESVMKFIKDNIEDEYKNKFKELELEGWYNVYDEIENSDIADSEKILHKVEVTDNVSKRNIQNEAIGVAKFGIGLLGMIKAIATIGNTINDMKDDQKTRRSKYKYKSK